MEIVNPSVEFWKQEDDVVKHIAKCARVCYASNGTKDDLLYRGLWKNKHRSMFRHAGVYYIIPTYIKLPYDAYISSNVVLVKDKWYVSTNDQAAKEYWYKYDEFRISVLEAENNEVFYKNKLLRYTFCIETGIDITREYNRKSPNNIAEQSTRYVDFSKKLGIRFKKCHWMEDCNRYQKLLYRFMAKVDEWFYKLSRSKYGLNLPPEDARWCLFLDTMSKVVYTYTVGEWEYIINMRKWDYTGKAHKDAKIVADMLYDIMTNELGLNIERYD